jgi:RNA polymerase sigma-70 factor (ECF subfamily)
MRDRKYIDRFQAGDFEAFGFLYERYIDNIFAFVYRKISDKEIAEDLTSRVWMKALKSLEFFGEKDNANFKSWIYRIAQNTVIDYYRCHKEQVDIDAIVEIGISNDFACEIDNKDKL